MVVSQIDPKKWALDPETGEYRRITFSSKSGVLVNKASYHERSTKRLVVIRSVYGLLKGFALAAAALVVCIVLTQSAVAHNYHGSHFLLIMLGLLGCLLSVGGLFYAALFLLTSFIQLQSAELELGPPPDPQPGREEVEQQKAYGDANAASVQDIHQILGGSARSTPIARPAPPGPLYDE